MAVNDQQQRARGAMRNQLDQLVGNGGRTLKAWYLKRGLRQACSQTLKSFYLFPIITWVVQVVLSQGGAETGSIGFWGYMAYSLLLAVLFVTGKFVWLSLKLATNRQQALALFDSQLQLSDRLVTADELLGQKSDSGFAAAAIDDARTPLEKAMQETLNPLGLSAWRMQTRNWLGLPIAAVVVWSLLWLGSLEGVSFASEEAQLPVDAVVLDTEQDDENAVLQQLAQLSLKPAENAEGRPKNAVREQSRSDNERDAERRAERSESRNKSKGNQSANANESKDSSGNGSNPQNQAQSPEEKKKQDKEKSTKSKRKSIAKQSKPKPQDSKESKPSGVMSGKGKGKSSQSSSDDMQSQSQKGKGASNPEEGEEDDDAADEDEQQKSATANKPSLNKKKKAANRDSNGVGQKAPPSDKPSPRGGPSGVKKSRGVPSAILGIPTPDRLTGTPNASRFKTKQEQSTPKEESVETLQAQDRNRRVGELGHLPHPQVKLWEQKLIKSYFLTKQEALKENTTTDSKSEESK